MKGIRVILQVLAFLFIIGENSFANLDSGLVAYYSFNGNLNDESGGYNAKIGPSGSYASGKVNDGLHGRKDCSSQIAARVDNFPNLDSFTIGVWIKPACPPGSSQGSLSIAKWVGGYSGPGFYIMANPSPHYSPDYKFLFSLCDVAKNTPSAVSPLTYICGNWYHIVGIRDKGNEVKLFVNGEEVASAIDNAGSVANSQPLTFHGGLESSCDWSMSEIILDEVAIYNRVLTTDEIQALYHKFEIYVSIDSLNAFPNDTLLIPINVIFQQDSTYSSAEFIIEDYQNGLDFIQVDTSSSMTGNAGWGYAVNEIGDSLVVTWLAGSEDIACSGVFCNLKFAVTGEPCTFVPVNIKSALFNTGQDSVEITNGGINIEPLPVYGDVDEDSEIHAYDAAMILKYVIGDTILYCQGLANADVTLNDTITALDASVILQYGVGLISDLPYDTSINGSLAASGEFSMEKEIGTIGGLFEIPILIKDGNNIYSFEGCLEYDPECLIFSEFSLPSDKSNYQIQFNDKDGQIQWAGAGTSSDGTEGIFINACFRYNPVASIDHTAVYLRKIKINEENEITNVDQTTVYSLVGIFNQNELPKEYFLNQNYPNPFNPVTTICYALPQKSYVTLTIYDINGHTVATLVNQTQNAGYYSAQWDASNVGSGIYFYRILADRFTDIKKCIILK